MGHGDQTVEVLGHRMAYTERGGGDPVVFLHGNPTSSHLWRDVLPHLAPLGRCVAPDLIGMGNSDKLDDSGPGAYRFAVHRRFLDAFLDAVGVTDRVVLVVHDWGSALGFDWARRHTSAVTGLAHMEAITDTLGSWEQWPEQSRGIFQAMNSEAGDQICLERNLFVERILPASVLRELSQDELDVYRQPYRRAGEDRRPTLDWPRQLPVGGRPADVVATVEQYRDWLRQSPLPKLWVRGRPGFLTGVFADTCATFPNQVEETVPGIHFLQEDAPDRIGEAVAGWYQSEVLA